MPINWFQYRIAILNSKYVCKYEIAQIENIKFITVVKVLFIFCLLINIFNAHPNDNCLGSQYIHCRNFCNVSAKGECKKYNLYGKYLQKIHNKWIKWLNGNIHGSKNINLMQYDKGNSNYSTKEYILNKILCDKSVDIACISEANLTREYLQKDNIIQGYTCELNLMSNEIWCLEIFYL